MRFSQFIRSDIEKVLDRCNLTNDEEQVFVLRCKGYSNLEISEKLQMSTRTVERRVHSIKEKCGRGGFID